MSIDSANRGAPAITSFSPSSVLDAATWHDSASHYDVITCLNVLDRCDRPLTLLRQMRRALRPGGLLVVALVLPLAPYVEHGECRGRGRERAAVTTRRGC